MIRAAAIAIATAVASLAVGVTAEAEPDGMVAAPAGLYRPFFKTKAFNGGDPAATSVRRIDAFRIDDEPVTNAQFLEFATTHTQWRKSQVKALFADNRYLRRWRSDLKLADSLARNEPVTNVSWFAAEAYCKARGLRLPTTDQWEYMLADAQRGQDVVRERALEWLALPNGVRPPVIGEGPANGFGVKDMVGLVWEWTLDFDAFAITPESRDPNGKEGGDFCGGAAAGVADPTDYPALMRYAMRASLKANYTADNLGFRCAGEAP